MRCPDQADDRERDAAVERNFRPEVRVLLRLLHQQGSKVGPEVLGRDGLPRGHRRHQRNRVRFFGPRVASLSRVRRFSADQKLGEWSSVGLGNFGPGFDSLLCENVLGN